MYTWLYIEILGGMRVIMGSWALGKIRKEEKYRVRQESAKADVKALNNVNVRIGSQ